MLSSIGESNYVTEGKRKKKRVKEVLQGCGCPRPYGVLRMQQQQQQCRTLMAITKFRQAVSALKTSLILMQSQICTACQTTTRFTPTSKHSQFRNIAPSHGLTQKFMSDDTEERCRRWNAFLKRQSKTVNHPPKLDVALRTKISSKFTSKKRIILQTEGLILKPKGKCPKPLRKHSSFLCSIIPGADI